MLSRHFSVLAENDRTLTFGTSADRASLSTMAKPHRILMLAFPDCQMLDVTGPLQMFAGVNDELGRQAYELVIAAPKRGPFKTSSGVSLVADLAIADVSPAKCRASDTLIAAGGDPGLCRALESGEIAALIKAARRRGAVSCPFVLAHSSSPQRAYLMGVEQQLIGATSSVFVDFDRRSMLILKRSTCVTAMSGHRQASRPASILRLR